MEYELRQQVVEPRRKTFQNLIDRYGDKPASRYLEASIDIQPTENFHYRPLWGADKELYDDGLLGLPADRSVQLPRPAPVLLRAVRHEPGRAARRLRQDAGLPRASASCSAGYRFRGRTCSPTVVLPLRHYESGAQLLSVNGARFAYGSTISQCLTYAAFDRIGNAQMLTRAGIALGGGSAELLGGAKNDWMERDSLQGLRRLVEELLIDDDWATQSHRDRPGRPDALPAALPPPRRGGADGRRGKLLPDRAALRRLVHRSPPLAGRALQLVDRGRDPRRAPMPPSSTSAGRELPAAGPGRCLARRGQHRGSRRQRRAGRAGAVRRPTSGRPSRSSA